MTKIKAKTKPRNGLIAALDIGTTKVCCFIARAEEAARVIGIGHQVSRGVRSGTIIDMEAAEESILAAVHAAEQMAGETLREVAVNITAGQPTSKMVGAEIFVAGHEINAADVRRVLDQGRQLAEPGDKELIHAIPISYTIDGSRGIRDPRGMYGERLGVQMHAVNAAQAAVRNLTTCVHRCHLDVEAHVASSYASGLACLVEDETELGVTVIDMGGGTCGISVFLEGSLVYTDSVGIGGVHVTSDIARGLSTPVAHAERMKTLYGSAVPSASDDREIIRVPLVGEDDDQHANQIPRSLLVSIIRPRLEETFELVRERLEAGGFDKVAGRRVVLTGGGSQMQGVRELAGIILDKQVRMGRPLRIQGLAEATGGPAFATCAGLLNYMMFHSTESRTRWRRMAEEPSSPMGRIGHWLRENF